MGAATVLSCIAAILPKWEETDPARPHLAYARVGWFRACIDWTAPGSPVATGCRNRKCQVLGVDGKG